MKNILCVSNAYPIQPRIKKIGRLFEKMGYKVFYAVWDCDGKGQNEPDNQFNFMGKSGYGHPFRKGIEVPKFTLFLKKLNKFYNFEIIYAFNFDAALCTSFLKTKKNILIYDAADLPIVNQSGIDLILKVLERRNKRKYDLILLGSRYFQEFYSKQLYKTFILENFPERTEVKNYKTKKNQLIIAFIGIVRYKNILKNLFMAATNKNLQIHIHGIGKDEEELKIFCLSKKINNVHFFGPYDYQQINTIYHSADCVWSVYPAHGMNEKLAISNKFYECLLYQVPGIFDQSAKIGELAKIRNIGYAVDGYNIDSIINLIDNLLNNLNDIEIKIETIKKEKLEFFDDYFNPLQSKLDQLKQHQL